MNSHQNSRDRQMNIGVAVEDAGVSPVAWRLPDSAINGPSLDHFINQTRIAEEACLDFVFVANNVGLPNKENLRHHAPLREFESITILSALAAVSSKIGLVGTLSTTYSQPYTVARQLSSLDHLSNGRAAWNIVTSIFGNENYGMKEAPPHEVRYAIADEYLDVCTKLWDSWEDDVKILDRESGVYTDPSKIHEINYEGTHFQVQGPLNLSRSPQGRPLLVQAGSSEWGMNLGARWADVVFTSQHDLAGSTRFYADLKQRIRDAGRNPDQVAIMPGVSTFVAKTEAEATEKFMALNDLFAVEHRIAAVGRSMHVDLTGFGLDDVIPAEKLLPVAEVEAHQSRYEIYYNWAVNEKRPIREIAAHSLASAGHWLLVGSGEQVADQLIERFEQHGADGFNLVPATVPSTLEDFIEHVLPILQERGYFRTEYPEGNLRDMLGIDRPESQYAGRSAQ